MQLLRGKYTSGTCFSSSRVSKPFFVTDDSTFNKFLMLHVAFGHFIFQVNFASDKEGGTEQVFSLYPIIQGES